MSASRLIDEQSPAFEIGDTDEFAGGGDKRGQQSDKIVLVSGLVQSPRQCRKFF